MVPTRVRVDALTGAAQTGQILVDEDRTVQGVKGALATDEVLDLLEPRRVIDELLEGLAGLVDLLQVDAVLLAVLLRVNMAVPTVLVELRNGVDAGVEIGNFPGRQRAAHDDVPVEIEEVDFTVRWFHRSQSITTEALKKGTPEIRAGRHVGVPGSLATRCHPRTTRSAEATGFHAFRD